MAAIILIAKFSKVGSGMPRKRRALLSLRKVFPSVKDVIKMFSVISKESYLRNTKPPTLIVI